MQQIWFKKIKDDLPFILLLSCFVGHPVSVCTKHSVAVFKCVGGGGCMYGHYFKKYFSNIFFVMFYSVRKKYDLLDIGAFWTFLKSLQHFRSIGTNYRYVTLERSKIKNSLKFYILAWKYWRQWFNCTYVYFGIKKRKLILRK